MVINWGALWISTKTIAIIIVIIIAIYFRFIHNNQLILNSTYSQFLIAICIHYCFKKNKTFAFLKIMHLRQKLLVHYL